MLAWLKKFRRPAAAKLNLALGEYRVGMIKHQCRIADREQRERIRACRENKLDANYIKELKP